MEGQRLYYCYANGFGNRRNKKKKRMKTIYVATFLCVVVTMALTLTHLSLSAPRAHKIHLSNLFIDTFQMRALKFRCVFDGARQRRRWIYNGRGNVSLIWPVCLVGWIGSSLAHEFNVSSVCGKWTKTKQWHNSNTTTTAAHTTIFDMENDKIN